MQNAIEDKYTQTSFVNIVGLSWTFVQKHVNEFAQMAAWHLLISVLNYVTYIITSVLFSLTVTPIIIIAAVLKVDFPKLLLIPGLICLVFILFIMSNGIMIAESTIEANNFQKIAYKKKTDGIIGSYFSNYSSFCYCW